MKFLMILTSAILFCSCGGINEVSNARLLRTEKGFEIIGEAECTETEKDDVRSTNRGKDEVQFNDSKKIDCTGYMRCNFYNSDMSQLLCSKRTECYAYSSSRNLCQFDCACESENMKDKNGLEVKDPKWAVTIDQRNSKLILSAYNIYLFSSMR